MLVGSTGRATGRGVEGANGALGPGVQERVFGRCVGLRFGPGRGGHRRANQGQPDPARHAGPAPRQGQPEACPRFSGAAKRRA